MIFPLFPRPNRSRYGDIQKKFGGAEPGAKKVRSASRIVTFCPPALAIRLNGPGTANPPPPRWRFRALILSTLPRIGSDIRR